MLDAGCGEGIIAVDLARRKLKIVGVDISLKQIERAHMNCNKNIFVLADLGRLPFRKDAFDLIFSLDTLEYTEDVRKVFVEFYHILKPKGKLFVSVTKEHDCSAKLFFLQRILRKITSHFLYTHDLEKGRGWLDLTGKEMAEKLGFVATYSLSDIREKSKGLFKITYHEYFIKLFMALARDFVYGVKGFYYLRFPLFFIAVRLEHYFFKNMPGYYLFLELERISS